MNAFLYDLQMRGTCLQGTKATKWMTNQTAKVQHWALGVFVPGLEITIALLSLRDMFLARGADSREAGDPF